MLRLLMTKAKSHVYLAKYPKVVDVAIHLNYLHYICVFLELICFYCQCFTIVF